MCCKQSNASLAMLTRMAGRCVEACCCAALAFVMPGPWLQLWQGTFARRLRFNLVGDVPSISLSMPLCIVCGYNTRSQGGFQKAAGLKQVVCVQETLEAAAVAMAQYRATRVLDDAQAPMFEAARTALCDTLAPYIADCLSQV